MPVATNVYSGAAFPGNFNLGAAGIPSEAQQIVRFFNCTTRSLAAGSHQVCVIPANSIAQVTIVPLTGEAVFTVALGDATTAASMSAAAVMVTDVNVVGRTYHYAADNEVQFTVAGGTLVAARFMVIVRLTQFRLVAV